MTPCCLPIYPSFLSYVTGVSIDELTAGTKAARTRMLQHSLAFFVGFSVIYVSLGLAASALGSFFYEGRSWLPIVGGIWVALMGLTLLGVIKLPFLMREQRVQFASKPQGYVGSVLVGLAFAAGWTPCIGPILGAVLAMAATNPGMGGILLLAYSIGFAIPFVALAYFLGSVRWLTRYTLVIERIGGGLMLFMGVLLATGYMEKMSAWLLRVTGFSGF
jgi:cytochrome c-type biogenesis protein